MKTDDEIKEKLVDTEYAAIRGEFDNERLLGFADALEWALNGRSNITTKLIDEEMNDNE